MSYEELRVPVGGFLPTTALRTIQEHHNLVPSRHRGDAWHQTDAMLRELWHRRALDGLCPEGLREALTAEQDGKS